MMKVNFENINQKIETALNSPEYRMLVKFIQENKKIFLLANGGLHYVASHAAMDMSRLIPGKAVYSFDGFGFITSNVNDYGNDNLFVRWLETMVQDVENPEETMVIGLSCSGNSDNVINGLKWAEKQGCDTYLISGVESTKKPAEIPELVFNVDYFHTAEILSLMLFYDVIEQLGNRCPTIRSEIKRKS